MAGAVPGDRRGGLPGRLRSLGVSPWVIAGLAVVVLASAALHLWGIRGDLPYPPDVDEPIFVKAALRIASHGSPDPGWVGHPGSTVIYPLAVLLRAWHVLFLHGPLLARRDPALRDLLVLQPEPFYLLGRLISAAYGVASVAMAWLVARRLAPDLAALLAAALLAVTLIAVQHGQLVRTDTAGTFWALVTLWLTMRAMDGHRSRDWVLAAIALGLAISSRYFFACLAVPYLFAAWLSVGRPGPGRSTAWRRWVVISLGGLAIAGAAFALTSPYVFLDFPRTIEQLRFEAREVHPGADGLSPAGNMVWYLTAVLPATIGLAGIGAALLGLVVACRSRLKGAVILVAFVVAYLATISASPLHWARYVIVLVPLAGAFMAVAGWELVRLALDRTDWRPSGGRAGLPLGTLAGRAALTAVGVGAVAVLLGPPLSDTVAGDALRAVPSTRAEATRWVVSRIPPGSAIAQELYGTYLTDSTYRLKRVFSLSAETLDDYRAQGWRYLISSSAIRERYDPARYPKESAFYAELDEAARLLATFSPDDARGGPAITVYQLPPVDAGR